MVDELKFQIEEKDGRIDDLESKRSDDVRRFETRIRYGLFAILSPIVECLRGIIFVCNVLP